MLRKENLKCGNRVFFAAFDGTTNPPNWQRTIAEVPGGYQNEDFIVWMRTAALPTFRKLYRKVVIQENTVFDKGLPAGNYSLTIDYCILLI